MTAKEYLMKIQTYRMRELESTKGRKRNYTRRV